MSEPLDGASFAQAQLWELLASTEFQAGILSGLILLVMGLVAKALEPKSKIIWGQTHQFAFSVPPAPSAPEGTPGSLVATRTLQIMNSGRATAEGVEIYLAFEPAHYQIWPPFDFEKITTTDGGFIIRIRNLGPRETLALELIHNDLNMPNVVMVRSAAGEGTWVPIAPMRQWSKWVLILLWTLVLIGAFELIQLVMTIVLRTVL